jgi:hypothetical protein
MIRKYEFGAASNNITHIQNFIKIRLEVLKPMIYVECRAKTQTWWSLYDLRPTRRTSVRFIMRQHLPYKAITCGSSALRGVPYCWIRGAWSLGGSPQHRVSWGCYVAWAELHPSHCSPRTGTRPGAICMRLQYTEPQHITALSERSESTPFSHLRLHSSVQLYLNGKLENSRK